MPTIAVTVGAVAIKFTGRLAIGLLAGGAGTLALSIAYVIVRNHSEIAEGIRGIMDRTSPTAIFQARVAEPSKTTVSSQPSLRSARPS